MYMAVTIQYKKRGQCCLHLRYYGNLTRGIIDKLPNKSL